MAIVIHCMAVLLNMWRPDGPQEKRYESAAIPTSVESLIEVLIPGAHAPRGDLASRGVPELGEDVPHVVLGRAFGNHQPLSDLPVGQALTDQPGDLGLA
jgi:hypothetical protein